MKHASNPSCQRVAPRVLTELPGKLVVPAEDTILPCRVTNLSASGAGIICEEPPPRNSFVTLRIPGLGELDAVTAWFRDGQLGLRFLDALDGGEDVRARLARWIYSGAPRAGQPAWNFDESLGVLVDQDGNAILSEVEGFDGGFVLRTTARPPMTTQVRLGKLVGTVVRHVENGIVVQRSPKARAARESRHGA